MTVKPLNIVAVGGVGGSGTRVVAEILTSLGIYLGSDLNGASDNLWFTLLFKRPQWFDKHRQKPRPIQEGLKIFTKAMTTNQLYNLEELGFILQATLTIAQKGHDYLGGGKGLWAWQRAKTLLSHNPSLDSELGWGWKEPNTHIYLPYLSDYFPNLKYIHVLRNGLDMAYSVNQAQLYNWASLFDVEIPQESALIPKASLNYWIKANQKAISLGKQLLGERFLLIKFEDICQFPEQEINKILDFLELKEKVNQSLLTQLYNIPKPQQTIGRYKDHNFDIFDGQEIEDLIKLGYDLK